MSGFDDAMSIIGCINPVTRNDDWNDLQYVVNEIDRCNGDLYSLLNGIPTTNTGKRESMNARYYLWHKIYKIIKLSYCERKLTYKLKVCKASNFDGKLGSANNVDGELMSIGEYLLFLKKGESHYLALPWAPSTDRCMMHISSKDDVFNIIGIFTMMLCSELWIGLFPLELYFMMSMSYSYDVDRLMSLQRFLQTGTLWWTGLGVSSRDYCTFDADMKELKWSDNRVCASFKEVEDIVKELGLDVWRQYANILMREMWSS